MSEQGVEVWRGSVESWECDAMGHMNVGFYIAKCSEGLVGLAAALGMPAAFVPTAESTLLVAEHHIRFLREALPGAGLHITAGVLEIGESDARLLFLMLHGDGRLAATFTTRVVHATARDGRPFPWPDRIRARAEGLLIAMPPQAAPRGLGVVAASSQASVPRADTLGLSQVAAGAMRPQDCDVFGRMRPEAMMFRMSGSASHLFATLRAPVSETGRPLGGAILEYRLLYLDPPGIGRRFVMRSGFADGDARARRIVHWMLDPDSGRAFGAAEAVAVALDLDTRRIVDLDAEAMALTRAQMIAGLTL